MCPALQRLGLWEDGARTSCAGGLHRGGAGANMHLIAALNVTPNRGWVPCVHHPCKPPFPSLVYRDLYYVGYTHLGCITGRQKIIACVRVSACEQASSEPQLFHAPAPLQQQLKLKCCDVPWIEVYLPLPQRSSRQRKQSGWVQTNEKTPFPYYFKLSYMT